MVKKFEHSHEVRRAKSGAGRRAIESKAPKLIESPKSLLLLYGHSTSNIGKAVLSDLQVLKKPHCHKLTRKNDLLPFESGGETHLENLCRLNDCSLFALTNHTKKRPDNLILGRTFGHRIMDMFEFGIEQFQPMQMFKQTVKFSPGSSPLVVFTGDDYNASETTSIMESLLLDLFRGPDDVKNINLAGIDRVIVLRLQGHVSDDLEKGVSSSDVGSIVTKANGLKVEFKQYGINLKRMRNKAQGGEINNDNGDVNDGNDDGVQENTEEKNGVKENDESTHGLLPSLASGLPSVDLVEVGPRFDMRLRRTQLASEALRADAMKKPKDLAAPRKKKNVSRDDMGDKVGRVHVGRQDLAGLSLARMKGLGKKRRVQHDDAGLPNPEGQNSTKDQEEEEGVPKKKVRFENDPSSIVGVAS